MTDNSFAIEIANWDADQRALRAVRTEVFIVEQNVPDADEWDELDARSVHVLARDANGAAIGTGRLTPERKIGRMAVLRQWRGCGIGEAMLRTLTEQALARHWTELTLHAQVDAIAFYERAGFAVIGEEFVEAGIRHQTMQRTLAAASAPERAGDRLLAARASRRIDITTLAEACAITDELLAGARHKLWIYTRDFDRLLYDREPVLESIRRVAVSGRGAQIQILFHEAAPAMADGHRLLHLAARLPTYIHLRQPVTEEDLRYPSAFLLTDSGGFYLRPIGSRFEGEAHSAAPGLQGGLRNYFERVWQHAQPDPELRRLSV